MTDQLFVVDGTPLEFYIPAEEENRAEIVDAVVKHGGKITEDASSSEATLLSKTASETRVAVDPKYIEDSVEKKQTQDINEYRVLGVHNLVDFLDQENKSSSVAPPDGSVEVDPEITAAQESSENAAAAIAASTATAAESGSSQPTLSTTQPQTREARLAAASAVPQGMFVTREDRINLHNKNGFTQQEDDIILEEVRKHPHRRSTHKLFTEIAALIGRHTGNSIRYRFRTHLSPHLQYVYKVTEDGTLVTDDKGEHIKVQDMPKTLKTKFTAKDDYVLCKAIRANLNEREGGNQETDPKELALPGKFFEKIAEDHPNHSRSAWRDRYRKFAVPFGIDKFISYYETEVNAGREPIEMKNFTGRHLFKSKKKTGEDDDIDNLVSTRLSDHNNAFKKRKNNNGDTANLFLSGDQNALAGISNNLFESPAAQAVAVANQTSMEPEDFLTEDLVTSKFFSFHPLLSVVDKITDIVGRNYQSGDAEQLIDALYEEAGVQKKFGTFIITSVCGDVVLIPKYFEHFLKTGQNPPEDVHGVWSPRDDAYLKSNDPEKMEFLRRLHSQKRIDLRKSFVDDNII